MDILKVSLLQIFDMLNVLCCLVHLPLEVQSQRPEMGIELLDMIKSFPKTNLAYFRLTRIVGIHGGGRGSLGTQYVIWAVPLKHFILTDDEHGVR